MPSTFFGLNIAGSGLRAANAALNTTANNISNSDTENYSRQKVVQQAADALHVSSSFQAYIDYIVPCCFPARKGGEGIPSRKTDAVSL